MEHFVTIAAGAAFGAAAGLLLVFNGRIAGISGVMAGLSSPRRGDVTWRIAFVVGLLAGGSVIAALLPSSFVESHRAAPPLLAAAGLLIGLGARLANGCTSGHGVCGVSRFSPRSIAAVSIFTLAGAATLVAVRALGVVTS
jgi:uncharacterized membrane protein YedE/YeeE